MARPRKVNNMIELDNEIIAEVEKDKELSKTVKVRFLCDYRLHNDVDYKALTNELDEERLNLPEAKYGRIKPVTASEVIFEAGKRGLSQSKLYKKGQVAELPIELYEKYKDVKELNSDLFHNSAKVYIGQKELLESNYINIFETSF